MHVPTIEERAAELAKEMAAAGRSKAFIEERVASFRLEALRVADKQEKIASRIAESLDRKEGQQLADIEGRLAGADTFARALRRQTGAYLRQRDADPKK